MKKFKMKHLVTFSLALALVFSISVPVKAAIQSGESVNATTSYLSYSLTIYSGVPAYTSSGTNTSDTSALYTTSMDSVLKGISVAIYPSGSSTAITSAKSISGTGYTSFSDSAQYPSQQIRAGFVKNNINDAYSIGGRFYYNGL